MDERKTLLSYIGPGRVLALVCLLLLAAALFCGFYQPPLPEAAPLYPPAIPSGSPAFSASETEGELVYLDTIAVSDAICSADDGRLFYAAEDDGHLFRIVCISGETYALMGPQRVLWSNAEAEASYIRLTGRRVSIPDEVKQAFLSVFSMDGDVFDVYFGKVCLVEEIPVAVTPTRSALWGVLALLFALGFVGAAGLWLLRFLPSWAALVRLEETERLSDAARQLDDPAAQLERGDRLRLTEGFLFGWRCGLAAAWEDVLWSFERNISVGHTVLARELVIRTADGRSHALLFSAQETKELRRIANALGEHSSAMRWGLTKDNRAAWENRTV